MESNFWNLIHRRLADEDDELSEVQPDAVPPEVREWLASTFTRQLATTRRKTDEKPKFRSVAHAIRAGIFVDRIYRRVTNTALMQFPPEVVRVLKVSSLLYYQLKLFYTYIWHCRPISNFLYFLSVKFLSTIALLIMSLHEHIWIPLSFHFTSSKSILTFSTVSPIILSTRTNFISYYIQFAF